MASYYNIEKQLTEYRNKPSDYKTLKKGKKYLIVYSNITYILIFRNYLRPTYGMFERDAGPFALTQWKLFDIEEIKRKHAILSANKIDFKADSKNGLEIRLNDDVIGIILSYL